ncbi:MAG: alanine dehydrogenase [Euryarchaeota archaeon]|nr:alanine dehydrogenase [Euryarchaeota archaeon]
MKIFWLSGSEVRKVLEIGEVIKAVEEAFRQHGLKKVQMPPKIYLSFSNGDLRAMPAYMESLGIAGVKIVNSHPENPKRGLPTVMAVVILNDPATGAPIAIMDGSYLTDMRTGAAGAVAVKHLARKDSKVVGMIGTGRQARTQLLAINEVLEIEEVKVASRSSEGIEKFVKDVSIECEITPKTIEEACKCDVLVTTTPVREPIVKSEWILEGTHINAIGADAPGKEELEPALLKRAKIVVDDLAQASHSGEINVPLAKGVIKISDIYCELGEIVAGKKTERTNKEEITIFDSTGLAIQDIAAAHLVYKKAKEKKLGKMIELF